MGRQVATTGDARCHLLGVVGPRRPVRPAVSELPHGLLIAAVLTQSSSTERSAHVRFLHSSARRPVEGCKTPPAWSTGLEAEAGSTSRVWRRQLLLSCSERERPSRRLLAYCRTLVHTSAGRGTAGGQWCGSPFAATFLRHPIAFRNCLVPGRRATALDVSSHALKVHACATHANVCSVYTCPKYRVSVSSHACAC